MKSEQSSEVENFRTNTASVKSPRQECANWARMGVKAGGTVRDEAREINGARTHKLHYATERPRLLLLSEMEKYS